jgi:excisionase family DNA binding protein
MTNDDHGPAPLDQSFLFDMQMELTSVGNRYGTDPGLDVIFLVYLRKMARFGYFTLGPVTIDVRLIEDIVEATLQPCTAHGMGQHTYGDDYVPFSQALMEEVRRSGRRRIDELHFLLAFMRVGQGLPARVFGELGITPEQLEDYARRGFSRDAEGLEKLYSPEDVAAYLGVHVQTVRAWIRSGRLPARRLAGQRALRVRASDLASVLEPIENPDEA